MDLETVETSFDRMRFQTKMSSRAHRHQKSMLTQKSPDRRSWKNYRANQYKI